MSATDDWTALLGSAAQQLGLSQHELAERLSAHSGLPYSQQAVSAHIAGRRLPGPTRMRALAEVLGVDQLRLLELADRIQRERVGGAA